MSRIAVSKKHKVSTGSVQNICREAGIGNVMATNQAIAAMTQSRTVRMAALRAELAENLILDAEKLRTRAWSPHPMAEYDLPLPPAKDVRDYYTAMSSCVAKHLDLIRSDSDPTKEQKSVLGELRAALVMAWEG